LQNFKSSYKTSNPVKKFHTQLRNFIPSLKTLYPITKFQTHLRNFIPNYEISYPVKKLHTQIITFVLLNRSNDRCERCLAAQIGCLSIKLLRAPEGTSFLVTFMYLPMRKNPENSFLFNYP
jgi:hypothetical protein